jgi:predicted heme/steroid binding protein/uncharacterized membrane protein
MDKVVQEQELQQNDGKEGRPAYVVYQGKVYDVSGSKMWREGAHVRRHNAGHDLTSEFPAAPHDESVLQRVTLVGQLAAPAVPAEPAPEIPPILSWFLDRHPHPISVHFPIAYSAALLVLLILNLVTGNGAFETAGYYMLWGSVIMAPVAIVLGVTSWSFNYGRKMKWTFMGKIIISIVFLIVGVVALTLRTSNANIFTGSDPMQWVYFGLIVVMVLLVAALGWIGDLIMYGK